MRAWEQGYCTASDRKLDEGLGVRLLYCERQSWMRAWERGYCTTSERKLDEGLGVRLLYGERQKA